MSLKAFYFSLNESQVVRPLRTTPAGSGYDKLVVDPITHAYRSVAQKAKEAHALNLSDDFASFALSFCDLKPGDFLVSLMTDAPPSLVVPLKLAEPRRGAKRCAATMNKTKRAPPVISLVQVLELDKAAEKVVKPSTPAPVYADTWPKKKRSSLKVTLRAGEVSLLGSSRESAGHLPAGGSSRCALGL